MSSRSLYNYLFFLIPIVYFLSLPIATGDLAVWIAHGKFFLQTGTTLRQDIYSVLPTQELIYPVGTSIIYAIIYNFSGLLGVSLFHKIVVLVISYVWFKSSLHNLSDPWSGVTKFIVLVTWLGTSLFCIDRPALIAMLPLLISFIILQKSDDLSPRDFLHLLVVNIVWVNVHGSWLLLIAMYCWREFSRWLVLGKHFRWQFLGGLCALGGTSLLNPFGYKVFNYVIETAKISKERGIDEWSSPFIGGHYLSQTYVYFFLICLVIMFGICLLKTNIAKAKEFFSSPFILLLLLGLPNIRNTSLAFFVLLPFASQFHLLKNENVSNRVKKINYIFVFVVFLLLIVFLPPIKPYVAGLLPSDKQAVYDKSSPFIFADYLENTNDADPVFNDWEYGSFLILSQKHPIFIDTRNIIYTREGFAEYLSVVSAKSNWESILSKYKIKYILLNAKLRQTLISKIENSKNWEMVKVDNESVLYKRKI